MPNPTPTPKDTALQGLTDALQTHLSDISRSYSDGLMAAAGDAAAEAKALARAKAGLMQGKRVYEDLSGVVKQVWP